MRRATCLLLLVPLIGLSQDQPSSPEALERAERAHQKLYKPDPSKSKTAAALTEQTADLRPGSTGESTFVPRRNFIDTYIFGRMEEDGIPHAGLASDAEFVRRAYLDATGRIPAVDKLLAFMADQDLEKRAANGSVTGEYRNEIIRYLNAFSEYCGALPVSQLKKGHVQHWI